MVLTTARTRLRRFKISDLENMCALESDPEITRYTPYRVPQTLEQTEKRLKTVLEKENERAPLGIWAVESKVENEFIGWFMLVKTEFEFPELGFMILKKHWNKGFATEVGQALIDYAFEDLKFPAVFAVTEVANTTSIQVLKKLGFGFLLTMKSDLNVYELRK
jgi:ribosomal-protein-alanine N-acetyltransferase